MIAGFLLLLLGAVIGTCLLLLRHLGDEEHPGAPVAATLGKLPLGLVEIRGRVKTMTTPLRSPLGKTCVRYRLNIVAYDTVGRLPEVEVGDGIDFVIDDGTGQVALSNIRTWLHQVGVVDEAVVDELPDAIQRQVLDEHGHSCGPALHYHLRECLLAEGASVYVLLRVQSIDPLDYMVCKLSPYSSLPIKTKLQGVLRVVTASATVALIALLIWGLT